MNSFPEFFFEAEARTLNTVNHCYYIICLCLGAFIGSVLSVLVSSGAVFVCFHMARGAVASSLPKPVKVTALAFAGFFLAEAVSALVNPGPDAGIEIMENLPFLGIWPVYAITVADRASLLKWVKISAAAASLLAVAVTIPFQSDWTRTELMAGNSNVLAVLAGLLYAINLIGLFGRGPNGPFRLSLSGAAASVLLLLSTGTRGMWPLAVLLPLLFAVCFPLRLRMPGIRVILAGVLGIAIIAGFAAKPILYRIDASMVELDSLRRGELATNSIGQRVVMWKAGLELVRENPIFGVGAGNFRQAFAAANERVGGSPFDYTHAHNALLTILIRSGLVGLIAWLGLFIVPLFVSLRAGRDEAADQGFALLAGTQLVYLVSGATGLALGHDIQDAVFITATGFCLYLVFGRAAAAVPDYSAHHVPGALEWA